MDKNNSETSEVLTENSPPIEYSYPYTKEVYSENPLETSRIFTVLFSNKQKLIFTIEKYQREYVLAFIDTLKEDSTPEVLIKYLNSQGFKQNDKEITKESMELINGLFT